jgi:hypothetical protein
MDSPAARVLNAAVGYVMAVHAFNVCPSMQAVAQAPNAVAELVPAGYVCPLAWEMAAGVPQAPSAAAGFA